MLSLNCFTGSQCDDYIPSFFFLLEGVNWIYAIKNLPVLKKKCHYNSSSWNDAIKIRNTIRTISHPSPLEWDSVMRQSLSLIYHLFTHPFLIALSSTWAPMSHRAPLSHAVESHAPSCARTAWHAVVWLIVLVPCSSTTTKSLSLTLHEDY